MKPKSVFSLNANDWYVALSVHNSMPPALPPVLPHVEGCVLSYGAMFAKTAPTVLLQGKPAVQSGHDVGAFIPHVCVPPVPPNPLLAGHIALSSCKVMFGKSRVLVGGQPAGWFLPMDAMLQVCADPVPLPIGIVPSVFTTTVKYGFSESDLRTGYADIALDIATSQMLRRARAIGQRTLKIIDEGGEVLLEKVYRSYDEFVSRVASKLLQSPPGRWLANSWTGVYRDLEVFERTIDKGVRWAAKKAIPSKFRTVRGLQRAFPGPEAAKLDQLDEADELEDGSSRPSGPEFGDVDEMLELGMLDEVPRLEGDT